MSRDADFSLETRVLRKRNYELEIEVRVLINELSEARAVSEGLKSEIRHMNTQKPNKHLCGDDWAKIANDLTFIKKMIVEIEHMDWPTAGFKEQAASAGNKTSEGLTELAQLLWKLSKAKG